MDIFHLLYRSRASGRPDGNTLREILEVSRRNNIRDLITGFLIYRDGFYMQLLEGPQKKVRECVDRIKSDPRNSELIVLGEVHSSNRMMPDWEMAYVRPERVGVSSESYVDLFDLGATDEIFRDKQALETMLRLFSRKAEKLSDEEVA